MRGVSALVLAFVLAGWPGPAAASPSGEGSGDLFVRLHTDRRERFLQEEFDFTLAVYSRGLTMGREIALLNRETPGLQFRPFSDRGGGREEIDGKVYDVRRFLGRAQAVAIGTAEVGPTVRVSVVVPGRGRGGVAGGAEIRQTELHPNPLAVRILPLPEAGRPEGYAGAVGSFTLAASVRPVEVAAGEPVTLTMDLRGSGTIGALAAPALPADDSFKVYEAKLTRKELGGEAAGGRLVFEQVLVPRSTAATSVPAVTFSYFDPAQRSYREIVRGPFPLGVRPSPPGGATVAPPPPVTPAAPVATKPQLPAAIAPLKEEPGVWKALPARFWHASGWFLALQCVPLVVVAAVFFATRRRDERARDLVKARRELAPDAAGPEIAAAAKALREGNAAGFHQALWGALSAYFGHRLNLRPGEIGGAAVTAGLAGGGHDPREVARLGEIFSLLEQERFGRPPGAAAPLSAGERQRLAALLEEVDRLLQACERSGA
jgi:hypothetical protein